MLEAARKEDEEVLIGDNNIAVGYLGCGQKTVLNEVVKNLRLDSEIPGYLRKIVCDMIKIKHGFWFSLVHSSHIN